MVFYRHWPACAILSRSLPEKTMQLTHSFDRRLHQTRLDNASRHHKPRRCQCSSHCHRRNGSGNKHWSILFVNKSQVRGMQGKLTSRQDDWGKDIKQGKVAGIVTWQNWHNRSEGPSVTSHWTLWAAPELSVRRVSFKPLLPWFLCLPLVTQVKLRMAPS